MSAGTLRRRTLLGGLAVTAVGGYGALAAADLVPGRVPLYRAIGLGDVEGGDFPAVEPGPERSGAFVSAHRPGLLTGWRVSYPPGSAPGDRLPVCVLLHGRGGSAYSLLLIGYDRFLAAAVGAGVPPFVIASVDGGNRFWHARRDGDDTSATVTDEFLPLLERAGLAASARDRIAFLGFSMGGYGSLLLASRLGPDRVAAVVAESPALWLEPPRPGVGAFDDREDFERNDVFERRAALRDIPVRIDIGLADEFYPATKEFAAGMTPAPAGDFGRGDHSETYWRARAPEAMAFIGKALAAAGR